MAKTPQVLIVDEDLDSRVETRKALQRAQLDIVGEVGQGAEALSFATESKPDAILISVEEPVTRPLETAEGLSNALPQTPLIFYSSLTDLESARRAMLNGARDYLTKPLQATRVQEAVERALEHEEKRQMREAGQLSSAVLRGTVITVTGAKGGIGKSVLSVNLALALRRAQRKVVIVDADTQFGDIATMMDMVPEKTASDLLSDLDTTDRWKVANYLTQGPDGIHVLATPMDTGKQWEDAGPESLRKVIDLLSLSYDFVVVDTAGSFDRFTRAAIEVSTLVLVVTTREVSSIRDTKSAFKRLDLWDVPQEKVKLVLNRGARADGLNVKDLEDSLGRKIFWELPIDKHVPRSVQLGEPMVMGWPKSSASRSVFALATTIGGTPVDHANNGSKPSLLAAIMRRGAQ